jgi:hypothetical protein
MEKPHPHRILQRVVQMTEDWPNQFWTRLRTQPFRAAQLKCSFEQFHSFALSSVFRGPAVMCHFIPS